MANKKKINQGTIRLTRDDVTLTDMDAFVFYARTDLKLGAGFGNAIAVRGGPSIQEELDKLGGAEVGDAVSTAAGKLKAKHIIHAVGPTFQEQDTEAKLKKTTESVLALAEKLGVERLALPAMGSGFYGVAPEISAKVALEAIRKHFSNGDTKLREVMFCLPDGRDMGPYQKQLDAMS
jgi:O-acetyl-ADP-ribose deacetylase (regulator of RNase III)